MKLRRALVTLLGLGLAAGLTGCAGGTPAPPASSTTSAGTPTATAATPMTHQFTDDLGNPVVVASTDRVVATMGSFANMWELAGGTLVGATTDAAQDYTLTSPDVAPVGDFTAPNVEQIIALNPDFVLMTSAAGGRGTSGAGQVDLRPSLVAAGIPVAYFAVTTFADYQRMMGILTDITGRKDLYEQNCAAVSRQIDGIVASMPSASPTVLLMTTYSGGTSVQNSKTMTGAMLADLGVTNLADQNPSLLKDFSLESIIAANPDFILVVPMGNDVDAATKNLQAATAANPAWASLDAVKNGRYVTLDPALFLYKPNANWGQSYQILHDILVK
ncbi:MAG: ABC transporter substrate-binding protein [Propionibacteriaceae bacterium]|jgi:iron complex transport system substrate-binding protein|nr:ABC transporter substrate-binding protein [Propionibacteriaceae bacterium]